MDKCFCHLNGYAVKDATARNKIEALSTSIEENTNAFSFTEHSSEAIKYLNGEMGSITNLNLSNEACRKIEEHVNTAYKIGMESFILYGTFINNTAAQPIAEEKIFKYISHRGGLQSKPEVLQYQCDSKGSAAINSLGTMLINLTWNGEVATVESVEVNGVSFNPYDVTGKLTDLNTADKTNLVSAINEVLASGGTGTGGGSGSGESVSGTPFVKISGSMVQMPSILTEGPDKKAVASAIKTATKDCTETGVLLIGYNQELTIMHINNIGKSGNLHQISYEGLSFYISNSSSTNRIYTSYGTIYLNDDFTYYSGSRSDCKTIDYNSIMFKNNAVQFTPTGDYNPATKKYVDDKVANAGGNAFTVVEGTMPAMEGNATQRVITTNYPDGYTRDNTVVVSAMYSDVIEGVEDYFYTGEVLTSGSTKFITAELSSDDITVKVNSTTEIHFGEMKYRIVLCKCR